MKHLTNEEYEQALDEGAGVLHFMGGYKSTNGQEILLLRDKIVLFEQNEVGNEKWKELCKQQDKEREYHHSKNLRSRSIRLVI